VLGRGGLTQKGQGGTSRLSLKTLIGVLGGLCRTPGGGAESAQEGLLCETVTLISKGCSVEVEGRNGATTRAIERAEASFRMGGSGATGKSQNRKAQEFTRSLASCAWNE